VGPVQLWAQWQEKELMTGVVQVPPFKQGPAAHSSMSVWQLLPV
jgi:hypothetical protein